MRHLLAHAAAAGEIDLADPAGGSRLHRARHGQARRARAQLFERYRPHPALRRRARRAIAAGTACSISSPPRAASWCASWASAPSDGYVFRTDLRLRPDPGSTPPAVSRAGRAHLLRERRPELGARGADQGAAGGRRPRGGRGLPGRAHALPVAQASRLRGDPGHPLDQAPDRRASRRRPHQRRRPQHQARPRRHPRDRVLRPDAAAHLGRPHARAARARDLRRARGARRRRPHRAAAAADELAECLSLSCAASSIACRWSTTRRPIRLPADEDGLRRIAIFLGL